MLKAITGRPLFAVLPWVVLLMPMTMGVRKCERVQVGDACLHEGELYKPGDSVPSGDDCNTCSCTDDGTVACTEIACSGDGDSGDGDSGDGDSGNGGACGGLLGLACGDGEYCNYAPDALCGAADQTGTCAPIPDACIEIYAPVCGCDDKTYGNDCMAAAAGVSVAAEGECEAEGALCGTRGAPTCGDGEYCKYPDSAQCGAADAPGHCAPIPDACDTIYQPVCGCDGVTYSNDCVAAMAGVSAAASGECGGGGDAKACGGLLGLACADDEYCNYAPDALCGAADATGICTPVPENCIEIYQPVCGCDGQTYGNDCMAAAAGVSVVSKGECGSGDGGGTVCGGLLGRGCADDEYCNYPPEARCGAADQTGTCAPKGGICTREYVPVCGCDGKTYGNACTAAAAGVSVASDGECGSGMTDGCEYGGKKYAVGDNFPSDDGCNTCSCTAGGSVLCTLRACADFCGGIAGFGCPSGQYCNFPPETQCGAGDQGGTCAPRPDACTQQYDPVCGCDGKTYGNACSAANAGVSVISSGECT